MSSLLTNVQCLLAARTLFAPARHHGARIHSRSILNKGSLNPSRSSSPLPTRSMVTIAPAAKKVKRFYKVVDVEAVHEAKPGFAITLDKRRLKTPKGHQIVLHNRLLAECIALEWDQQESFLQQKDMHMTSLAFTVIDQALERNRAERINQLLEHVATDTVLFRERIPEALYDFQVEHWDSLLKWFSDTHKVPVNTTFELDPVVQAPDTMLAFRSYFDGLNTWGFEGFVYTAESARSIIIAMATIFGHIDAERATFLAALESEFQTKRWGSVEWAHGLDKLQTQNRVAAGALFVNLSKHEV